MTVDLRFVAATGIYVLLFGGAILGVAVWRQRRRKERWPVETKLLRGPGESLRRRAEKLGEDLLWQLYAAAIAPPLLGASVILFLGKTAPTTRLDVGLALALTVTLAGMIITGTWACRRLRNVSNHRLGHFGERVVAEHLEPLRARGYRIFHDVPAEGRKKKFNLDHVTVGATGVVVIETKTPRKRRALPGRKDHEVTFDGQRLIWPWGEGSHGIEQAMAEAEWLQAWIHQRTGLTVAVRPILTMPGWWVNETPSPTIRIVNSKILPDVIAGRGERVLSDEQIDLIARQLDLVCRDVED